MSGGFNVSYIGGGRFDPPFMPTKQIPYIKGFMIELPGQIISQTHEWVVPFDIELASVSVGASKYLPRDYWNVTVGEGAGAMTLLETIYTKDLPEGAYLMAIYPVTAGTKIKFRFVNDSGSAKFVWINYQSFRDRPEI